MFFLCILFSTYGFSQTGNDSTEIINLLKKDYITMGNWDVKSHQENITSSYLLLENGEIWDTNKDKEYYLKNANRLHIRKDYFDIKTVKVTGTMAYAVYFLKSDFTENGTTRSKEWLESTIFRKVNGKWKIELLHSTLIQPK